MSVMDSASQSALFLLFGMSKKSSFFAFWLFATKAKLSGTFKLKLLEERKKKKAKVLKKAQKSCFFRLPKRNLNIVCQLFWVLDVSR